MKICGSHIALLAALCVTALAANAQAAPPAPAGSPAFAHKKPLVVERKTFDPDHLPTPAPPLKDNELAVCVASSQCSASLETETLSRKKTANGFEAAVHITSVNTTISMNITLWLPKSAPQFLIDHEEGHRQIVEQVYATAEKVALAASKNLSGKTFTGVGKTAALAEKDALLQAQKILIGDYTAHVCAYYARVNDIYDDLTAHSQNSNPDREHPIDAKTAITQAFKQYAEEQAAKKDSSTQPSATQPASQP